MVSKSGLGKNTTDGLVLWLALTPEKFNELLIAFLIHIRGSRMQAVMQTDYFEGKR